MTSFAVDALLRTCGWAQRTVQVGADQRRSAIKAAHGTSAACSTQHQERGNGTRNGEQCACGVRGARRARARVQQEVAASRAGPPSYRVPCMTCVAGHNLESTCRGTAAPHAVRLGSFSTPVAALRVDVALVVCSVAVEHTWFTVNGVCQRQPSKTASVRVRERACGAFWWSPQHDTHSTLHDNAAAEEWRGHAGRRAEANENGQPVVGPAARSGKRCPWTSQGCNPWRQVGAPCSLVDTSAQLWSSTAVRGNRRATRAHSTGVRVHGDAVTGRGDSEKARQRDSEAARQRDSETERQRGREAERQKDSDTATQREGCFTETERSRAGRRQEGQRKRHPPYCGSQSQTPECTRRARTESSTWRRR